MAFISDVFHHFPGELAFFDIFTPISFDNRVSFAQAIGGDGNRNVMGNVNVNIVTEELNRINYGIFA